MKQSLVNGRSGRQENQSGVGRAGKTASAGSTATNLALFKQGKVRKPAPDQKPSRCETVVTTEQHKRRAAAFSDAHRKPCSKTPDPTLLL